MANFIGLRRRLMCSLGLTLRTDVRLRRISADLQIETARLLVAQMAGTARDLNKAEAATTAIHAAASTGRLEIV
jgi:hypothetical protein